MCKKEKKQPTHQKPQDSSFAYLALLPCRCTWRGRDMRCSRGAGLASSRQPCRQKKGIFLLLSLLILVNVGHALTSRALPCLGTAQSQKRKPQAREAALSTGAAAAPERGTRGVRGDRAAGKGSGTPDPLRGSPGGPCWGGCWRRWRRWCRAVSAPAVLGDER